MLNHSYSHPDLTTLPDAAVSSEISQGISTNLLRPPYGAYDSRVATIAAGLGYRICTWTIDTLDWQRPDGVNYRSASSIRSIVRTAPRSAKASGVILGHLVTNYPTAISGIIYDLQRRRGSGTAVRWAAWRRSPRLHLGDGPSSAAWSAWLAVPLPP